MTRANRRKKAREAQLSPLQVVREEYQKALKLPKRDLIFPEYIMAISLCARWPNIPILVWGTIIGSASSGKSTMLNPLRLQKWSVFRGRWSEKAMTSGYVPEDGSDSPSLAREVHKKLLVVHDTAQLAHLHDKSRASVLAELTDAWDGHLECSTGTGAISEKCWFGILMAGVPRTMDRFFFSGDNMGHRFMHLRMTQSPEQQHRQALRAHDKHSALPLRIKRLSSVVRTQFKRARLFIKENLRSENSVEIPPQQRKRFVRYGELVSAFRTVPEYWKTARAEFADSEAPTRFSLQLRWVCWGRAAFDGRTALNRSDFEFAARIAHDSVPAVPLHMVRLLYNGPKRLVDLQRYTGLAVPDIRWLLEQYREQGFTEEITKSSSTFKWKLSEHAHKLIDSTGFLNPGKTERKV